MRPRPAFFGKSILRKLLPDYFRPHNYLMRLTAARTKYQVYSGPFKGMHYVQDAVGSAFQPKLVGTYEKELSRQVQEICALHPSLILDVGAAEGYYAVGLALRNPGAQVVAFEAQENGRELLQAMAQLNQVTDRLEIRGKCEVEDLRQAIAHQSKPVIVCDCEGYEEHLLDPAAIPELANATILVETHECFTPGLVELLQTRFAPTHEIESIVEELRTEEDYPWRTLATRLMPKDFLAWAVDEWRPGGMIWLWMRPKRS